MSDGRTNWTRQDARDAWARSGLTYDVLTPATMERLRSLIDATVRKGISVDWELLTVELVRAHDALVQLKK